MFQPLQELGGGGDDTALHQSLGDVCGEGVVVYPDKMCQTVHPTPSGIRMAPTPGRRWLQRYEMGYIQKSRGLIKYVNIMRIMEARFFTIRE